MERRRGKSGVDSPAPPTSHVTHTYFVAKPAARVEFQRKSPIVGSLSQSGAGDILE